jgi:hypothetical protein
MDGQLPTAGRHVVPQDVASALIAANLEIPVVEREPRVDDRGNLDSRTAEREARRRELAAVAGRAFNSRSKFKLPFHALFAVGLWTGLNALRKARRSVGSRVKVIAAQRVKKWSPLPKTRLGRMIVACVNAARTASSPAALVRSASAGAPMVAPGADTEMSRNTPCILGRQRDPSCSLDVDRSISLAAALAEDARG